MKEGRGQGRGQGEGGKAGGGKVRGEGVERWKMAGNSKKGGKFETGRMRVLVSPSIGG